MKLNTAQHIITRFEENKTRNEDTVMVQLIPLIRPSESTVPKNAAQKSTDQADTNQTNETLPIYIHAIVVAMPHT